LGKIEKLLLISGAKGKPNKKIVQSVFTAFGLKIWYNIIICHGNLHERKHLIEKYSKYLLTQYQGDGEEKLSWELYCDD